MLSNLSLLISASYSVWYDHFPSESGRISLQLPGISAKILQTKLEKPFDPKYGIMCSWAWKKSNLYLHCQTLLQRMMQDNIHFVLSFSCLLFMLALLILKLNNHGLNRGSNINSIFTYMPIKNLYKATHSEISWGSCFQKWRYRIYNTVDFNDKYSKHTHQKVQNNPRLWEKYTPKIYSYLQCNAIENEHTTFRIISDN